MFNINNLYELGVSKVDADRGLVNVSKSIARKLDRCVDNNEQERVYDQVLRVVSYKKSNLDSVVKMFVGDKSAKEVIKSIKVIDKGSDVYDCVKIDDSFMKVIIVIHASPNDTLCVKKIYDVERQIFKESCTLSISDGDIYAIPTNSACFEAKIPSTVKYLEVIFG